MTPDKIREKAECIVRLYFDERSHFNDSDERGIDAVARALSDFRNEVIEEACEVFHEDLQCDEEECRKIYGWIVDRIRSLKSLSTKDGEG